MDIVSITKGFQLNRVRFADGSAVDVRHHAKRPGPRCKTPAEVEAWKADEDRFVRAIARRSYAAHCREAKELKAIVYGMGALAERSRDLVQVIRAGASPVCDLWRNADKLTGNGMEDLREDRRIKLTKADQVLAFFQAIGDLANVVCQRTVELYQYLPIVRDIDPVWTIPGSMFGSKLEDAAPYYPAGVKLPAMQFAVAMDDKKVYVCDERQKARLDRERARREKDRAAKAEGPAVRPERGPPGSGGPAAKAVVVPPAIADRMKLSLNGHARLNGAH